jgi:hypothetical protein
MDDERLESFRAQAHQRDINGSQGVAWSGLGPEAFRPRTAAALQSDTTRRAANLDGWRRSGAGRALSALAEVERHAEAIRTALARNPARDLADRAYALTAAAQAVLRALR